MRSDQTPPFDRLAAIRVVPVVVLDDPEHAEPLADALVAGGLPCAEVTFRTPAAEAAIRALAGRTDILVGAGTIVTAAQVDRAVDAGARFLVSPGIGHDVLRRASERDIPVLPGVATASEAQTAVAAGLGRVKFFPAETTGGVGMLSALSAPFPGLRFMPSGGVNLANVTGYLAHPAVFAVGGSWMVPRDRIATGDFDAIRRLTAETVAHLGRTAGS
ncbi:MAG TPA: bifunctional 4-hydroxy-2-oxoglutarate aldolase/2-dehydro-3-deoxy-phosphogluconate aldolase [Homoserinimonas sp.]|nr:bifunctional 4-hydroxy-2-oxoglutarate aldolase/2-dehydro-3-deoxy-phosphogluconate aldolase [Homoserinimonas sp.]